MSPSSASAESAPYPLLLYDGDCALCHGTVKLVLRFDRVETMRFAPLGGPTATRCLAPHPALRGVDSIVFVDGGHAWVRSDAVLHTLRYLGWPWKALTFLGWVPRPLRDAGYRMIAASRYRLFGQAMTCEIPPVSVRHRFLLVCLLAAGTSFSARVC